MLVQKSTRVFETLPFMGRKAIPRAGYEIWRYSDICSCTLWRPTSVVPQFRSGITQVWHIQRHPLSTHMTCSHLFTLLQNTLCRMSTCVSASLGFISSNINSKWVHTELCACSVDKYALNTEFKDELNPEREGQHAGKENNLQYKYIQCP